MSTDMLRRLTNRRFIIIIIIIMLPRVKMGKRKRKECENDTKKVGEIWVK